SVLSLVLADLYVLFRPHLCPPLIARYNGRLGPPDSSLSPPAMSTYASRVEQLRWKKFPVLDDGFVCLVDIMGDDQAVVQAARVSYGEGTRAVSDDRTLIRYLM